MTAPATPASMPMRDVDRYECAVGSPGFFLLNQAAVMVRLAFGEVPYLVGSAITSKGYRDVDVRLILDDADFKALFPTASANPRTDAFWSLLCSSVSLYLRQATGLPVDFQIQSQHTADTKYPGRERVPLGVFDEAP